MQFATILLAAALAVTQSAALVVREDVPLGYQKGDMQWSGVLEEGGPVMRFSGTIESIEQQVKAINPKWTIFYEPGSPEAQKAAAAALERRGKDRLICDDKGLGETDPSPIGEGITYLRGIKGTCGGGPKGCTRVSCSYNAAIWLCNDTDRRLEPQCSTLADYAQIVKDQCTKKEVTCPPRGTGAVCTWWSFLRGRQYDTDGYNVSVGSDKC